MSDFTRQFIFIFGATEVACLLFLYLGTKLLNNPTMMKIGEKAHVKKMRALDKVWPLTQIRPALAENNPRAVTVILSFLITLKSIMCFFFGVIMVFWLPLASLMVPSIIHRHDPNEPDLQKWVRKVSFFQITSHAIAASLGASLFLSGYQNGSVDVDAIMATLYQKSQFISFALFFSFIYGAHAGRTETEGIVKRGNLAEYTIITK